MTSDLRERIQKRYLRDGIPVRLGGLAANLARINSFSLRDGGSDTVESLVEESKCFIEWTATDLEEVHTKELAALSRQLANWKDQFADVWNDPLKRQDMSEVAARWSARVLEMSGLLETGLPRSKPA